MLIFPPQESKSASKVLGVAMPADLETLEGILIVALFVCRWLLQAMVDAPGSHEQQGTAAKLPTQPKHVA